MAINAIAQPRAVSSPDNRFRVGAWVTVAAIAMFFTSLSSAYVVRGLPAPDWQPLQMPRVLIFSSLLILISSLTLELARRSIRRADGRDRSLLLLTGVLGIGFLGAQFSAWRELAHQGVFLASNPHSSFFYLLTAMHGLHLIVGLLALGYLIMRSWRAAEGTVFRASRAAAADGMAIYWHFLAGLWIYLFLLLFV
jgi:cytochrome c oxidase subunit III